MLLQQYLWLKGKKVTYDYQAYRTGIWTFSYQLGEGRENTLDDNIY